VYRPKSSCLTHALLLPLPSIDRGGAAAINAVTPGSDAPDPGVMAPTHSLGPRVMLDAGITEPNFGH
jgi:hypothetical protein